MTILCRNITGALYSKKTENVDKRLLQDQSLKDDRNRTVFKLWRNDISDDAFLTEGGRLFHAQVSATGNARSPVLSDQYR